MTESFLVLFFKKEPLAVVAGRMSKQESATF
jgi:hypothetical protein